MDQNQPSTVEPTLEESVAEVMRSLPPVIREYLAQGKYTPVAKGLMAKYQLRIDQGGVLEREIMLLLMGVETPDEFVQTLAEEARLDQQTINSITQDVNDQIFVPLRKEEMNNGNQTSVKKEPVPVPAPPIQSVKKTTYEPPPQSPRYFPPKNNYQPTPAQRPLNMGRPSVSVITPPHHSKTPSANQPIPTNISQKSMSQQPTQQRSYIDVSQKYLNQKPMASNRLLEDHEEPSPSLKDTKSTARIDFPSWTAPPARPLPPQTPPPPPPPQTPIPPPQFPSKPKPYSTDPYHEPIDEN